MIDYVDAVDIYIKKIHKNRRKTVRKLVKISCVPKWSRENLWCLLIGGDSVLKINGRGKNDVETKQFKTN